MALEDVFVGASVGNSAQLFIQNRTGSFSKSTGQPWEKFASSEEIGAHFFDADNDGDFDLYVASGSTEFPNGDKRYQDRLYINNGKGNFQFDATALPASFVSTQVVVSADIDGDGDLDLFAGGRNSPGAYPKSPESAILINHQGKFTDKTESWNTDLKLAGMVTDAVFADITGDNKPDLILCSEWSAIRFFENTDDKLVEITEKVADPDLRGWWYSLNVNDIDNDGDLDIVAGNLGLNNKFHPSKEKPLSIYMNDFDDNGTNDIVLAKFSDNVCVPIRGKECSSDQMPFVSQKFPTFKGFAEASLADIYTDDKLSGSVHLEATEFSSMVLVNENGIFTHKALPRIAQISPINGIAISDVNQDGNKDILTVGNLYGTEVETSRYDASVGMVLLGDGKMNFTPVPTLKSGFYTPYDAKAIQRISLQNNRSAFVVVNRSKPIQVMLRL